MTCAGGTDNGSKTVTATSLFNSATTTQFGFQITGLISPPTTSSIYDSLTITTMTGGYQVDTCKVSVSSLTANSLTVSIGPNTTTTTLQVNKNVTIRFSVTLSDSMSNLDTITIGFPSGSKIFSPTLGGFLSFRAGVISGSTVSFAQNTTTTRTYPAGYILNVSFSTYTTPSSTQLTSGFTFSILRDDTLKMTGSGTLQVSMNTHTFTVTPSTAVINQNTSYAFSLVMTDPISSSGRIKIEFPSAIRQTWTDTGCARLTGSGVVTTASCSLAGNILTLSSLNSSSSNIAAQTLTINVSGVMNP